MQCCRLFLNRCTTSQHGAPGSAPSLCSVPKLDRYQLRDGSSFALPCCSASEKSGMACYSPVVPRQLIRKFVGALAVALACATAVGATGSASRLISSAITRSVKPTAEDRRAPAASAAAHGLDALPGFIQQNDTDAEPIFGILQVQVGNCGSGFPNPCDVLQLAAACNATCGCAGFDTYVRSITVPSTTPECKACCGALPVTDASHYHGPHIQTCGSELRPAGMAG